MDLKDRAKWVELYRSGKTLQEIADEAGCSRWTVTSHIRKAGGTIKKTGVQISPVCKRCGCSERYSDGKCKNCRQLNNKRHYYENQDWAKARAKKWASENLERINTREKARYDSDINFKMVKLLRGRLNNAVLNNQKGGSAVRDLGCSIPELRTHLESQFRPHCDTGKMFTWEDWGNGYGKWNIDHIVPLSSFDLRDYEQVKKACHYTNLRPLEWRLNLEKSDKIEEPPHVLP